ncbi:pericentrin isoform X2 [Tiliqua scincoides]|uniref:pericentrin isoform X2 n=1 Tax=Tiliqua scincoides TaxID=71010 RepID=UPI003461B5ED
MDEEERETGGGPPREEEAAELGKIISLKMEEQGNTEELEKSEENNINKTLQKLRAELEECHNQAILKLKKICMKELNVKYKNDLEQIKNVIAANSEVEVQNLNIMTYFNNKLQESEVQSTYLCKELENCIGDVLQECSEIDLKYRTLVEELMLQLSNAEECTKKVEKSKHEKECLNKKIEELNTVIQELNDKLVLEEENNKGLRSRYDKEVSVYNMKLKDLEAENMLLREVSEEQKTKLQKMQSVLYKYEHELQLPDRKTEFSHNFTVDTLINVLEDTNQNKVKIREDIDDFESDSYLKDHMAELGAVVESTEEIAKCFASTVKQGQLALFNSPGNSGLENFTWNTFQYGDALESKSDKSLYSFDEQIHPSYLVQEALNESELDPKFTALSLSGCCSPQNEIEEHKDKGNDPIDIIKQIKGKDATAEVSCVHLKEKEAYVGSEEFHSQKIEMVQEDKRKQGENSDEEFRHIIYNLNSLPWEEMVKDLQQEKESLMMQLRVQEQLVKDVQEQKTASDSVTSEVQSLFGRQLAVLQRQRDQMQAQLDIQKAKNKTLSELLGQKAILEKDLLKQHEDFRSKINDKEQSLFCLIKEKSILEEKLLTLEKNLITAENSLEESINNIKILEQTVDKLNMKMKSIQELHKCERLEFEENLKASNSKLEMLSTEMALKEKEYIQEKNKLSEEVAFLKNSKLKLEIRLEEVLQNSVENIEEIQSEMKRLHDEEIRKTESHYQSEVAGLKLQHQKAIELLNAEIKESMEKQQRLEAERKEQFGIIKKVHEREHDREIAELIAQHEDEIKELHTKLMKEQEQLMDELQQKMETTHQEEMQQAEALYNLKVEALRLNSNNIHTSQLELIQTNLRKEKEIALIELRETLNDKHAQEIAVLQSRYQFEMEHIKEQNQEEKEEIALKHQCDLDREKKKTALEIEEKNAQILENLKKEWQLSTDNSLKDMSEELSVRHQTELNEMKRTLTAEVEELKGRLESLSLEKEQTKMEYKTLENHYHLAMTKLQTEHEQKLQEIKDQSKKREEELQQEVEKIQAELERIKADSQEEIRQLWSQLDSARASRQELSELKEQLLARTSHMEEIEYLKKDFQLKWDKNKSAHETELEQLRLYFEQKLKAVEENYREELMMLHQRLQEMKDYSLLELENDQEQHVEIGPSITLLEEMTEKERRDLFEQLTQQLEHHKEELACLQLHLDEKHKHEMELLRSSLVHQYQESVMKMKMDLSDRYTSEIEELKRKHCLSLEQLRAKISEEHLREITKLHLQNAQDAARQVETEVSERLIMMENEYKVKLEVFESEKQSISTLQEEIEKLKKENTRLKEVSILEEMHFKKELEQIKCKLVEEHAKELRRTRGEVQEVERIHKAKAEEWKWKWEDLKTKSEDKLSLVYKELENKAEVEKQALQKQFELREAEMTLLQEQQAARIVELEKSLKEQQNSVRQLEASLLNMQISLTQYDNQLASTKDLMVKELEKTKHVLQEEYEAKLKDAQNRFVEEGKAMTAKLTTEHEVLVQELRGKHAAELELQSKELQLKHKEHILSLTTDLQGKHEAETNTLRSILEKEHQAQIRTHVTDIQRNHQAQITELEAKHLTHLDTLESTYLSEIQLLRNEHRQALEDLQIDLREQLLQKDKANQMLLAQELDRMKLRHSEELQICQDNLKIELTTVHLEKLKIMAAELEEAHKEDLTIALEKQSRLLEDRYHKALDVLQGEIFHLEQQHKKALQEIQDLHVTEVQKEKENGQLLQKATEQLNSDKQQLEEKVASLNRMIEDTNGELKNLLEQRDRENKEGDALIALLRSDIEFSRNQRKKLQECCQQALKLLLKMVKATKDTEDLIFKKIGHCIDDTLASGDSRESDIITGEIIFAQKHKTLEKWDRKKSDRIDPGKVLDQTPPECSFDSSVPDEMSELSEHLCESIFENPDLVFENEERIHKICHCLHIAVEKLLELVVESTKELESAHKIHTDLEEEFSQRNWEACQVVNEHRDLMDCFNEESEAKNQLSLELHKAKGLIEGYLAERHVLEEALILKEESACRLVEELESVKAQFQELTQEHARTFEEQQLLINQNKVLAANLGEREVDLLKEVEHLAKAKLDLQCQAEKDSSTMNAQMKILEMELEEQLNKNHKMTTMSLEVTDLRQQIQALERQLKNQRDFMDKQAVEREHERDEFQEEIEKLEKQLKQMAKCEGSGQSREYVVESLRNEIKERMDAYDKLLLERDQLEKEIAVKNEEIKKLEAWTRELESLNMEGANTTVQLSKELQQLKKIEVELKQDKEELQQQQYNNLIQISSLQSKLDEVRHKVLTGDNLDQMLKEKLKTEEELLIKKNEVEDLLEQLKQFQDNLMNKNEEVLLLSSKLEKEKSINFTKIIQLQEENVQLRGKVEKLNMQNQNQGDNEATVMQFLKTLLEEKNEETDHLNEQIMRLENKLENSRNNEVLEKQMLEIENMKSAIEYLRGDKEQLLRDKTEEIEQLHGVIEKLQMELALLEPIRHEVSDTQDNVNNLVLEVHQENLPNELNKGSLNHLESRGEGDSSLFHSSQEQLQEQLDMVLTDRDSLQQLLAEKESQFKMDINILEQNLQNVQASSRQHLAELTALQLQYNELQDKHKHLKICSMQRDTEMTLTAAYIQELEDKLREKEAKHSERELQLQAVSEQKAEQAAEVHHIKENIVQLENELQALVETLCDKEATYQGEINKLQATIVKLNLQIEKSVEEQEALRSERDLFHSQLKSYMEKIQDNAVEETNLPKLVPKLDAFASPEEINEEREPSSYPSESAELSDCDTLEENIILTNLKTSYKDLNSQDECLQGVLLIQEAEITSTIKEPQNLKPHFQQSLQINTLSQSIQPTQKIFENVQTIVIDETSWDSPEIMRKQNSMELQASLPLTPFSNFDGMDSIGFESLFSDSLIEQEETSGLLGCHRSYSNGDEKIATYPSFQFPSLSGLTEYNGVQKNILVRDAEGCILIPSELQDDLRSTMSRLEGASIDHGSNTSSDLVLQLNQEDPETMVHQDGNVMAYLQYFGIVPDITKPALKEKETFSQQLKNVLKMVYEESYKILVLSEKSLPLSDKKIDQQTVEGWQRERLTLLDAVQSLKDYLNKVPNKDDKELSSAFFDWRGELLQAVQCVLEKERNMLQSYLQSHFCNPGAGDEGSLIEKLEHMVKQQEQQQKIVLEHLLSSDRNSLLTEIQDLQAQLRLMHFQNQEKLQQLQATLINTENHGSQQEHQLRRQVELLEYKLQQEKSIASDLQTSLKNEQEKASELHELLKQEHTAILNLKADLSETKQTNEKLQNSLQELQKEVIKYSSALEDKEKAMAALLQDFQNEHLKEKELQNTLDEQQNQHKIREDEKSKALEELQAALELQCIQNNQLSVALEHEQVANSNLRKELQIENSRYEALLSQDQNKILELQRTVDIEKNRSLELLNALNHERVLTEQLSMRINECLSCKHKDSLQELQAQLYIERSHARELAMIIEKTRQQVLVSKKQTSEMQLCHEEPQKEKDLNTSLQVTQAFLQNQKEDIIHALEVQQEKEAQLKREWKHLQSILRSLREQENKIEQRAKERKHEQQTERVQLKELKKAQENQHELELQQWQISGRIKELQQMLEDLKEQEGHLNSHNNLHRLSSCSSKNTSLPFTTDAVMLHVKQQKLENIREQLLVVAAYLSEFIYKTVDKAVNWSASNDEAVGILLHTLEELKAELLSSSKPLVTPICIINSIPESEGIDWQEEKPVLQNGLKAMEYKASKTHFIMENHSPGASNLKLQKLYRKYVRAESFRKALVYQKKYLLLLLGGFQECEQATLSLIARMGIYPSPPDLNISKSRSRSFTKFRSAVRVVIAVLRLKFLVKKWQKVSRKEMPPGTTSLGIGPNSHPSATVEVLRQQQPFPHVTTESPATHETGYSNRNDHVRLVNSLSKSPHHLHTRVNSSVSQVSSKDPEHSLTEYISHLEAIQQRLGIIMPGLSSGQEKPQML